ncbi:hypothetical protein PCO31110_02105 [Pandoraea communis]|uniref:Uncharacterized protein n=1 Tax=Pandoraea communis TaxID=2508297 RepID=A0A5E4UJW9_9BURK|nr:hypothetical protein [Pandoraea communis]VVE00216.1 hypothetical protein PCO31110_02105 [Pandoraea communis]
MQSLINEISVALEAYRKATTESGDVKATEDFSRLIVITEKIVAAIQTGDITQAKLSLLGFSRQVSDSFAVQPLEFGLLAKKVAKLRKLVI